MYSLFYYTFQSNFCKNCKKDAHGKQNVYFWDSESEDPFYPPIVVPAHLEKTPPTRKATSTKNAIEAKQTSQIPVVYNLMKWDIQ